MDWRGIGEVSKAISLQYELERYDRAVRSATTMRCSFLTSNGYVGLAVRTVDLSRAHDGKHQ